MTSTVAAVPSAAPSTTPSGRHDPVAGPPATTRLQLSQLLGYASGDAANNLAFSMASMFLLIYYTGSEQQSQAAQDGIRYLTGFVPAIIIAVGVAIMLAYPLTEQTFTTMVAQTRARRAARDVPDAQTTAQEA